MNLGQLVVSLLAARVSLETLIRDSFDSLPRHNPRRKYGRVTEIEKQAFRLFFQNGIRREEIAAKFGVSFLTVYTYTR